MTPSLPSPRPRPKAEAAPPVPPPGSALAAPGAPLPVPASRRGLRALFLATWAGARELDGTSVYQRGWPPGLPPD